MKVMRDKQGKNKKIKSFPIKLRSDEVSRILVLLVTLYWLLNLSFSFQANTEGMVVRGSTESLLSGDRFWASVLPLQSG